MKSKLESIFVILIMLLSIANIKFCADAIMRLSDGKTIELIEGLEVYTLQKKATDIGVITVNGIYYNTLQEAIDACTNTGDVVTLQRNVSIDKVTIPAEKNITIDLNGFTIIGTIENSGTLSIINNKGTVTEGSYGTITGNGTTNI